MKISDWNIVCKTIGKQLNMVFFLGAISTVDYFLADAIEKMGFPVLLVAIFKGVALFAAVYHLLYAIILTKKIVEKLY